MTFIASHVTAMWDKMFLFYRLGISLVPRSPWRQQNPHCKLKFVRFTSFVLPLNKNYHARHVRLLTITNSRYCFHFFMVYHHITNNCCNFLLWTRHYNEHSSEQYCDKWHKYQVRHFYACDCDLLAPSV